MSRPDRLIDLLYKTSFSTKHSHFMANPDAWRAAIKAARRFVLDDAMSGFLGELGTRAFVRDNLSKAARIRAIEHLRMGARLPAETVWIEYNLRECQQRNNVLIGRANYDPTATPQTEGWLIQRHPQLPTAFIAHIVTHDRKVDHGDGHDTWVFPVALAWTADMDTVLPWRPVMSPGPTNGPSEVATGITGYVTERMAYVYSPLIKTPLPSLKMLNLLKEWAGVQRRMWALLATINDLPVLVKDVRASKGFVAKGAYRKFLDHKTVTLTVPTTLYRKTIRDALAIAHRRGGVVREHWRKDWRRPLSPLCDHVWSADAKHMFCTLCEGRKIWITEHVRGDTSVGFVTRDYNVTHEETAT